MTEQKESCATTASNVSVVSQPIIIHAFQKAPYGPCFAKVGKFKRKTKGKNYESPRILLRPYFNKHIGKKCVLFEAILSLSDPDNKLLQDREALIIFLLPKPGRE